MFSGAYSDVPYSAEAYSSGTYVPADDSAWLAFLAEVTAARCWLLELDAFPLAPSNTRSGAYSDTAYSEGPYSGGASNPNTGVRTLRYSTHGFTSQPGDTPASTWYDGRIAGDILVERAIVGRDGIGGLSRTYAEITLINRDGALDTLLRDYALDGRAAKIYLGRETGARADFGVLFSGIFDRASVTLGEMKIRLSDGLAKLDVPVQATKYAGTGALEGGADLAGKPQPRGWGKVFNISPPLVDSLNLIYQVHAGAIQDVPAVRDRGIALTKVTGAPAAGEYLVDTAAGTFQLGAAPAGAVTCDAELDAAPAGYVDKTGDIILRLLAPILTISEIDTTSFAMLNSAQPAPVGIWIGTEERTSADVVDELLISIGAFGGFSRAGLFTVGRVDSPAGITPAASYTDEHITALEREPLPAPLDPVVWRMLVGYQKNYTLQTDFAAAVPAAVKTFAAEPQRVAQREDAAVASRRLLAREYGPTPGLFRDQADADAEAQRQFDLWSADRAPYRVRTRIEALAHDLGDVIEVTHPRLGLANGASLRIIGARLTGTRVELRAIP